MDNQAKTKDSILSSLEEIATKQAEAVNDRDWARKDSWNGRKDYDLFRAKNLGFEAEARRLYDTTYTAARNIQVRPFL